MLPGGDADVGEARGFHLGGDVLRGVDHHAGHQILPVLFRVAGVVDHGELTAGLQDPLDLPEADGEVFPEIYRLKGRDQVQGAVGEGQRVCGALVNLAAAAQVLFVHGFGLFHADRGDVHAVDPALPDAAQQPPDVVSAAAADVCGVAFLGEDQLGKAPLRHGGVAQVHAGKHHPAQKAPGIAEIVLHCHVLRSFALDKTGVGRGQTGAAPAVQGRRKTEKVEPGTEPDILIVENGSMLTVCIQTVPDGGMLKTDKLIFHMKAWNLTAALNGM